MSLRLATPPPTTSATRRLEQTAGNETTRPALYTRRFFLLALLLFLSPNFSSPTLPDTLMAVLQALPLQALLFWHAFL